MEARSPWFHSRAALVLALVLIMGLLIIHVLFVDISSPKRLGSVRQESDYQGERGHLHDRTVPHESDYQGERGHLHDRTVSNLPLHGPSIELHAPTDPQDGIVTSTELFAQHGKTDRGMHLRMKNVDILGNLTARAQDPLLVLVVLNDHESWGAGRSIVDFFAMIGEFTHPQNQTSVAILTSDATEFDAIHAHMQHEIHRFAQFNLILRDDFAAAGLTRGNRKADELQAARRRMLARYRNYLLLSTLETWHEHVLWLDSDVHVVAPTLVTKIIKADRDIVQPICFWGDPPSTHEYDYNAWVGGRQHMGGLSTPPDGFVRLDSVGGTFLYVKADIHRQGVRFPHYYTIGADWDKDGTDGIETEGLCYEAHFLGYRCWGMPNDPVYHVSD
ncbi:hypothetical protein DYB37_011494 [Aphanomyces astaci]|uniref:Uncharacterized protein n=1 Tax=Aphanomyces astaci TaxID=112090 RepID=A0A418FH65_APHAT|nr:hypothetical protein DYB35_011161 [Aphanomyces astaci]RHZ29564.1 hypothetical protein DYB37_011494 [Aphanomyces astaci]